MITLCDSSLKQITKCCVVGENWKKKANDGIYSANFEGYRN